MIIIKVFKLKQNQRVDEEMTQEKKTFNGVFFAVGKTPFNAVKQRNLNICQQSYAISHYLAKFFC